VRRAVWLAGAPVRAALIAAIWVYRFTLSGAMGGQCRFVPSCSVYAQEAIATHGAIKGLGLAAWRVGRCNPFGTPGPDPVPAKKYENIIHRGDHAAPTAEPGGLG